MILSWQVAKQRIANGQRPGFFAAWLPVVVDWAMVLGALALVFGPVMRLLESMQIGLAATFLVLFALFFVPMQVVLINAAIWAVRSRWQDPDRN